MTDLRPATSASFRRTYGRRNFLSLGLGLSIIITLSACTPTDDAPKPEDGDPVKGGVLTYFEPQTWTLLWQDPETLELHPWLATQLPEVNGDATQVTFTIRRGVIYSGGSALTAQNVAKNFDLFGRGDEARTLPAVVAIATLAYVIINFIVDLAYPVIDVRLRSAPGATSAGKKPADEPTRRALTTTAASVGVDLDRDEKDTRS